MAISKIILNGVTQMDLTADTVAVNNLIAPNTAHGANGEVVVGTASGGASSGLSGKKVVFLGDSIGYGEGNNGHSFVDIISEKGICSSVVKECHSSATVGPYQPWSEAEGYDCIAMIQA